MQNRTQNEKQSAGLTLNCKFWYIYRITHLGKERIYPAIKSWVEKKEEKNSYSLPLADV